MRRVVSWLLEINLFCLYPVEHSLIHNHKQLEQFSSRTIKLEAEHSEDKILG